MVAEIPSEIEEVSRDGRTKKYTNKSGRDNYRRDVFLHILENKMYGCISSVVVPTSLVCVLFGPTIPTSSIYLVAFYTCTLYSYT